MTDNALTSLWGAGHVNATRTRECVAMPGLRPQEIFTPDCILDVVAAVWPEGIALDPASDVGRTLPAAEHYDGTDGDGLRDPWRPRTYVNPPYGKLKLWMAAAARAPGEVIMLCPVRTHRRWFDLSSWDLVCFLRPLKFVGYDQAFPAPLCLLYRGDRLAEFIAAASGVGKVGAWLQD